MTEKEINNKLNNIKIEDKTKTSITLSKSLRNEISKLGDSSDTMEDILRRLLMLEIQEEEKFKEITLRDKTLNVQSFRKRKKDVI